jgi:uncharacterized membrane protein
MDEYAFGYSSYSISKTGADEYGKFLPVITESFGDYKLALYSYFLLPFIKIFGLSEAVVRLPSVIAGLATIILIYFFIKEYLGNKTVAFLTSLLVLISPWHVVFSRTANEATIQVFLIVAFFLFWVYYQKRKKALFGVIAIVSLCLSIISYYSSFVFIPILIFFFTILHKDKFTKNKYLPLISTIVVIILVLISQPLSRVKQTSFFKHEEMKSLIVEALEEEGPAKNLFLTRFFHNKVSMSSLLILRNYFQHFTFDFLFLSGDKNYSRYSIPYTGPLYLWELPFIVIGLYFCFYSVVRKKDLRYLFVVVWILLAFIPDSLSYMETNTQRTAIIIPMIQLTTVLGLVLTLGFIKKQNIFWQFLFILPLMAIVFYNYTSFIHNYFVHQKMHQSWQRDGYAREMIETINALSSRYQKIVISGSQSHLFFFYNKTDPRLAAEILKSKTLDNMGFNSIAGFDKYIFMPLDCPKEGKLGVLYVCRGNKVAYNTSILKVIRYPDNQPARIFLTFTQPTQPTQAKEPERISWFTETIQNPKIIPANADRYWEEEAH